MSDNQVTYTITVDKAMFPFAPGSEVVVRNGIDEWRKAMFLSREGSYIAKPESGSAYGWNECHPLATHGHLLGTTYPADTPACTKCGKAQPYCVCEECFAEASNKHPPATTADGVAIKRQMKLWHPELGRLVMPPMIDNQEYTKVGADIWGRPVSEWYSKPCARLADGSVTMVGSSVWHPVYGECVTFCDGDSLGAEFGSEKNLRGVIVSDCYPLGSRIMTPEQYNALVDTLNAITAERDALLADMDAGKDNPGDTKNRARAWELVARTLANSSRLNIGDPYLMFEGEMRKLTTTLPAQPGEFQPFQRVLVRDADRERWTTALYGYPNHNEEGRHRCCGGLWRYVLPYDGNEHLLGTTDTPK